MNTRLVIAALWFFAALYAGSMLHNIAGLSQGVGLAVGTLTAAVLVLDPFSRFAERPAARATRRVSSPDIDTGPEFDIAPPQGALAAR